MVRAVFPVRNLILGLFFLLMSAGPTPAAEFVVPSLERPVTDEAGILTDTAVERLEKKLRQIRATGGPQIAILTTRSLEGLSVEEAAIRVAEKWGLGSSKKDDGILILVAPRDRAVRVEVGQGLEGVIPDVIAGRIIRKLMLPDFSSGRYDRGLDLGVSALVARWGSGEESEAVRPPPNPGRASHPFRGFAFLILILILFLLLSWPVRRQLFRGQGGRRDHWGGFGSGGFGGWSGGGGGGWSGGGGGFSGGGASGRW